MIIKRVLSFYDLSQFVPVSMIGVAEIRNPSSISFFVSLSLSFAWFCHNNKCTACSLRRLPVNRMWFPIQTNKKGCSRSDGSIRSMYDVSVYTLVCKNDPFGWLSLLHRYQKRKTIKSLLPRVGVNGFRPMWPCERSRYTVRWYE